ncbi:MAG: hypothetical protein ACREBN_02110, partial [Burkholderiaceae bacterium]
TSLVRLFLEGLTGQADVVRGACEALFTPRPLGPIGDMTSDLPPGLAAQIHSGNAYNGLFPSFFSFLRERTRPAIVVIEDAHWADEATLDFIKYVGRRIDGARALLVVTLRDDELGLDHPLRLVLGDLPVATTRRVLLAPFSRHTVESLARAAGRDAGELQRLTGGNPLYLSEMLASPDELVPASVRDAVLARFGRLSSTAQRLVELVSIEPGSLERHVVNAVMGQPENAIREAADGGVLRIEDGRLAFRHEIARQCIETELPFDRRLTLHAHVLDVLQGQNGKTSGLARQVHHAIGAGRVEDVAALAPLAAEEAARLGSHREAAALYRRALEVSGPAVTSSRATLLEACASESQKTGALREAIQLREEALELRLAAGDRLNEGTNLRLLGVLRRQSSGDKEVYLRLARAAVHTLQPLGPSGELAKSYASLSHALCLLSRYDEAIDWGEKAVALSQARSDPGALALALNRHGAALLYKTNNVRARAQLERALALA